MPQIPQRILENVFFLYRSEEDARSGTNPWGTGFIVGYPNHQEFPRHHVYYAITNWHVACDQGASVIRLNTKDGKVDILPFGPEDWTFQPYGNDIAAIRIELDEELHAVAAISVAEFAENPATASRYATRFGVGEDVFMLGLFVDHSGKEINIPSARFGNISMLPDVRAPMRHPNRYLGPAYMIDMHSRTGFSGSPVYVYRTFGQNLATVVGESFSGLEIDSGEFNAVSSTLNSDRMRGGGTIQGRLRARSGRIRYPTMMKLLGIHWGQFNEDLELTEIQRISGESNSELTKFVRGMSGMTCVSPSWAIAELLEVPELKTVRDEIFARMRADDTSFPVAE